MAEDLRNDELTEFFKKKENQETVLEIVRQMRSVFGREWFTFNQLRGVFKKDTTEKLIYIVRILYLCKFLRSKRVRGVERYRVSMAEIEKVFRKIEEDKKEDVVE